MIFVEILKIIKRSKREGGGQGGEDYDKIRQKKREKRVWKGEKACKIRDNKLEKYYNMDFTKESMEHEFKRNARTAEAEQSKRAASRVKPTELENSLLKEVLVMSSENCEELMKQSNQEQARAEQNRKLISELKQSVELLKNSNELIQDAISGEIGSLKDEVKENTVKRSERHYRRI